MARDEGFDVFVLGASRRLLRTAFLLVGDRGTAEDLLQDVLERMYARWSRIDDPHAYARRAIAHAATNRWRTRRRHAEVPLGERDAAAGTEPESACRDVLAALATLPPGQRAVVILRFFDDLSIDQTAAALGCSTGTVKSQTARALPRLRALLAFAEEPC
ncbi:MAG: polymerase sigma-70 factor, sigma-E family [Frankiales bacterium]|nr:polymerase sigma-70 factor, sigma-E family [Frankiales bacterium]